MFSFSPENPKQISWTDIPNYPLGTFEVRLPTGETINMLSQQDVIQCGPLACVNLIKSLPRVNESDIFTSQDPQIIVDSLKRRLDLSVQDRFTQSHVFSTLQRLLDLGATEILQQFGPSISDSREGKNNLIRKINSLNLQDYYGFIVDTPGDHWISIANIGNGQFLEVDSLARSSKLLNGDQVRRKLLGSKVFIAPKKPQITWGDIVDNSDPTKEFIWWEDQS